MPKIKDGSKSAKDWFNESYEFGVQGNYDQAIRCYDQVLLLNINYAEIWNNKGAAVVNGSITFRAESCITGYSKQIEMKR
jgi:tetratricopeptide (TPR) repeat protein